VPSDLVRGDDVPEGAVDVLADERTLGLDYLAVDDDGTVVHDQLVRELRDRDHEDEIEEQLEIARVPYVAVLERPESRRAKKPRAPDPSNSAIRQSSAISFRRIGDARARSRRLVPKSGVDPPTRSPYGGPPSECD
jgi:hypothetical protein